MWGIVHLELGPESGVDGRRLLMVQLLGVEREALTGIEVIFLLTEFLASGVVLSVILLLIHYELRKNIIIKLFEI